MRGLRERGVGLGHAEHVRRILGRHRHRERLRVGVPDVLGREPDEPPRDVHRVLARLEHAREPVDRGVRVAVAHRLVQRRDEVEVLLAGLVVEQRATLEQRRDVGDLEPAWQALRRRRRDPDRQLQQPERRRARRRWRAARWPPAPRRDAPRRSAPRPRSSSSSARRRMATMSLLGERPCSTKTFDRDSSAAFTSKEGFSVVAPTRTMSPASTRGRKASCCALLNRWISSTNRIVRRPRRRRACSASVITALMSLMPDSTALKAMKCALVIARSAGPASSCRCPGGPQRTIDCRTSRSIASRSGRPGASRCC